MIRTDRHPPLELMELAAALRVTGKTWDEIGAEIGRSGERIRHWPRLYSNEWKRIWRDAESRLYADFAIEARQVVRIILRGGKSEHARLAAARDVLRLREAERMREFKRHDAAVPPDIDEQVLTLCRITMGKTTEESIRDMDHMFENWPEKRQELLQIAAQEREERARGIIGGLDTGGV
jgi:hypothetical protein